MAAASGCASLTSTASESGAEAAGCAAAASVEASPATGASAATPSIDGREAMSGGASSSSSSSMAPSAPPPVDLGFLLLTTFFFVPRWERCEGESSRAFVTAFVFSAGGMTELLRVGEARHGNWPIETACLLVGGRRSRREGSARKGRTNKSLRASAVQKVDMFRHSFRGQFLVQS